MRYSSQEEEECATWRALDAKWETTVNSPLHHDNRCTFQHCPNKEN